VKIEGNSVGVDKSTHGAIFLPFYFHSMESIESDSHQEATYHCYFLAVVV
jgi:hypothetical protein